MFRTYLSKKMSNFDVGEWETKFKQEEGKTNLLRIENF